MIGVRQLKKIFRWAKANNRCKGLIPRCRSPSSQTDLHKKSIFHGLKSPRKNLTTHNSPLIAQCQTFLLLSIGCALLSKWTKTGQNSSKTNLKSHSKLPYCEILTFQLGKNNFPVEK
jgi:hypothetical protein